jgi:hypothetical protein
LHADQALSTTGIRTLEDIVEFVQEQQTEQESKDEAIETDIQQQPPVSRQDVYKGFDQLRRYTEENAEDPKIMQACRLFEDFLHQQQMKSLMQAPITQFTTAKDSDQPSIIQFLI